MDSINFTDLTQKMTLLKELYANRDTLDGVARRRYIAIRHEVATKLLPLFDDLEQTDMLDYHLRKDSAAGTNTEEAINSDGWKVGNCGTVGKLGNACDNSCIQLMLKN